MERSYLNLNGDFHKMDGLGDVSLEVLYFPCFSIIFLQTKY